MSPEVLVLFCLLFGTLIIMISGVGLLAAVGSVPVRVHRTRRH